VTVSQSSRNGLLLDTFTVTITNTGSTPANPTFLASYIDGLTYFNLVPQLKFVRTTQGVSSYTLRDAPLAAGASVSFNYFGRNMVSLTVSQAATC